MRMSIVDSGVYKSTRGGDQKRLQLHEYEAWIVDLRSRKVTAYTHIAPDSDLPEQVRMAETSRTAFDWGVEAYQLRSWIELLYESR